MFTWNFPASASIRIFSAGLLPSVHTKTNSAGKSCSSPESAGLVDIDGFTGAAAAAAVAACVLDEVPRSFPPAPTVAIAVGPGSAFDADVALIGTAAADPSSADTPTLSTPPHLSPPPPPLTGVWGTESPHSDACARVTPETCTCSWEARAGARRSGGGAFWSRDRRAESASMSMVATAAASLRPPRP